VERGGEAGEDEGCDEHGFLQGDRGSEYPMIPRRRWGSDATRAGLT